MISQQIERLGSSVNQSKLAGLGGPDDRFFFNFSERFRQMKYVWAAVMAGLAGLAALVVLNWHQIEGDPVSAAAPRADLSSLASAPQVAEQPPTVEELRRRGLELLRTEFPEDQPSPPLGRGDRLELHDATLQPVVRVATADADDGLIAPAGVPTIAASPRTEAQLIKPPIAKQKQALKRPVYRHHARRSATHRRDRVRMAHATYLQTRGASQTTSAARPQTEQSAPEETSGRFAPWLSWKDDWDKFWSK
jgi:hypothetical protein